MPNFFNFSSTQDQAGQQAIPVLFRWLDEAAIGQPDRAGQWTPFTAGPGGELLVRVATIGPDALVLEPDNQDHAPVATNSRVPVDARNYALDTAGADSWRRVESDEDQTDQPFADGKIGFLTMGRNRLYLDQPDTWVRERGQSTPFPVLAPLASRSATTTFDFLENTQFTYMHFVVNITVIGVDTLTVSINGFDPTGFTLVYPILTSAAFSTTGLKILKIGPGFTPVANQTANDFLPFDYQIVATHSGAAPITYSIGVHFGK